MAAHFLAILQQLPQKLSPLKEEAGTVSRPGLSFSLPAGF
jgi:hypothetical protein